MGLKLCGFALAVFEHRRIFCLFKEHFGSSHAMTDTKEMLGNLLLPLVVFLYSSGIPQMRDMMKKGDTQGYSFMPFLFLQVNAFIWTVYAFHFGIMGMLQPALGNGWGLLVNTAYLVVFGKNMKDPEVKKKFVKTVA